jgi:hypothetical protein
MQRSAADSGDGAVARSLLHVNLVAAVAFILGGSFFALGAVFAQLAVGSRETVNITYLVGGFFFSLGGYTSIVLVVDMTNVERGPTRAMRMRWWSHQPHQLGWSSAVVLFVGTLLFAVSLVAAFAEGLTPRQSNGWIWLPDILGCVCFLVSGHLALVDVCGGRIGTRVHNLGWWVVVVNQIGSILFFLAGLAAFTRPATSRSLDIALVNWGTFAGAVCFAIGGGLQIFDKPKPARRERFNAIHDEAE